MAANPATPSAVLLLLIGDARPSVRWAVPDHPNADLQVQHAICASPDAVLRGLLAEVPGLDAEISARLLADPVPDVRHRLACQSEDPAVMAALLTDASPEARKGLALNDRASDEHLRILARDRSAQVRGCVAMRAGMPTDIYELLAQDRSVHVRDWLAQMGYAPRHVLEQLTHDSDFQVAQAARHRIQAGPVPGP